VNLYSHSHQSGPGSVAQICHQSESFQIVAGRDDFAERGSVSRCTLRATDAMDWSKHWPADYKPAIRLKTCACGTLFGNVCSVPAFQASRINQPRFPRASARDARSSPGFHIVGFQPVIQNSLKTCATKLRRLRQRSSGRSS